MKLHPWHKKRCKSRRMYRYNHGFEARRKRKPRPAPTMGKWKSAKIPWVCCTTLKGTVGGRNPIDRNMQRRSKGQIYLGLIGMRSPKFGQVWDLAGLVWWYSQPREETGTGNNLSKTGVLPKVFFGQHYQCLCDDFPDAAKHTKSRHSNIYVSTRGNFKHNTRQRKDSAMSFPGRCWEAAEQRKKRGRAAT